MSNSKKPEIIISDANQTHNFQDEENPFEHPLDGGKYLLNPNYKNYENKDILNISKTSSTDRKIENLDFSIIKLGKNKVRPLLKGPDYQNYLSNEKDELVILVTAYNEGKKEFERTLEEGINKNVEDLYLNKCKNIKVVIIVDGLKPFYQASRVHVVGQKEKKNWWSCMQEEESNLCENPDCLKDISEKGCMIENYFKKYMSWKKIKYVLDEIYGVEEHYLQEVSPLNEDEKKQIKKNINELKKPEIEKAFIFCQNIEINEQNYKLIFCIKEQNKRKLNTHIWFLKGFCQNLKPEFIIFLDVGTKPLKKSLSPLYNCLKNDKSVAGCCGEIIPEQSSYFDFVIQAQIVEYKFSHLLDKALESYCGFISVLPGAFSAYRFECFTKQIMEVYFFTETQKNISMFQANMYLAEDRILCLELVCMSNRKNILRYLPNSQAETDVPSELWNLMMQRRRWNNGAWFSSIYTILNCKKIFNSGHGKCQKIVITCLMIYYTIVALFSWILVGAFYVSFSISLKKNLNENNNDLNKLEKYSTPIIQFYVSTIIALIICSLSVKPQKIKHFINVIAFIYGLYSIATIILSIIFIFRNGFEFNIESIKENFSIFLVLITVVSTFFIICLRNSILIIMKGILQFLFLTGSYVNLFLIYSICNIHDVSWGNRPGGENNNDDKKAVFEIQRITWLCIWIGCNGSFGFLFNWISGNQDESARKFIIYFAWITFGIILVKIVGGILFYFQSWRLRCLENRNN